jgi:DNA-binding NarL/FixJ family response regulator
MKLLLVEDNPLMRRVVRRLVADLVDEICECGNGAEACALYAAQHPDWVLMDVEMPGVNGLVATARICADFPEARILIVTNYDDAALRAAAAQAGACGYVLKDNLWELRQRLAATAPTSATRNP